MNPINHTDCSSGKDFTIIELEDYLKDILRRIKNITAEEENWSLRVKDIEFEFTPGKHWADTSGVMNTNNAWLSTKISFTEVTK